MIDSLTVVFGVIFLAIVILRLIRLERNPAEEARREPEE